MGHGGHVVLGQKLLKTQCCVGWCVCKLPIKKWANMLKESSKKKNSLKLNAASHNNASWYTDPDGFLEHSPSGENLCYKGPTLQKIILVFWGSLPCVCIYVCMYLIYYLLYSLRNIFLYMHVYICIYICF